MIDESQVAEAEAAIGNALKTGDQGPLKVLGYGEITVVVGWPTDHPTVALKRLPPSRDRLRLERYADLIDTYCERLRAKHIRVAPHDHVIVAASGGGWALYNIQPLFAAPALAIESLRSTIPAAGNWVVRSVIGHAIKATPELGIDAQFTNWFLDDNDLILVDTTTPILRDQGKSALDVGMLLTPMPAVLRPVLRRFVVPDILARLHDPRSNVIDLTSNLHRERLADWIPHVLDEANRHLDRPIERSEVDAYYHSDKRLWSTIQRAKRTQRWWSTSVRRRPYPVLLPGPIER